MKVITTTTKTTTTKIGLFIKILKTKVSRILEYLWHFLIYIHLSAMHGFQTIDNLLPNKKLCLRPLFYKIK